MQKYIYKYIYNSKALIFCLLYCVP